MANQEDSLLPLVKDLSQMSSMFVGGATGSGKSAFFHSLVCGLLKDHSPGEVQFVLYDAKQVEFSVYARLPHLRYPVLTEVQEFVSALDWAVSEVECRLDAFGSAGCGDIREYNDRSDQKLPYVVIVADEIADALSCDSKELISLISRIAASSQVTGVLLVLTTSRLDPKTVSEDLLSSFSCRVAFKTRTADDSKLILGCEGAEKLVGRGDFLIRSGLGEVVRAHVQYVSDDEMETLVEEITGQAMAVVVDENVYASALSFVRKGGEASISSFQSGLSIGFSQATEILNRMKREGLA